MKRLICCFVLSAVALLADVSGKWAGTFTTSQDDELKTAYLNLKQSGGAVTGTAGPSAEQQFPITKGIIEGDKITLDVQADEGVFHLSLMVDGDHMKGEASGQDGEGHKMLAKLDLKRER